MTEEAFYGEFSKADDKLYLHEGSIAKGSEYYYKYLTVSITCGSLLNYINIIFWKKQGEWYKEIFDKMKDGEFKRILRDKKYYRFRYSYNVSSYFVLVKQLEYEGKKYDWIFATNLKFKSAASYVKRYKKRWAIETIYRVTDDIRAYTTSTNSLIRYFLFMFTCFVYNIWKFFQMFLGEDFTLANFKVNMTIFMVKSNKIYPTHYDDFEKIAAKLF